MGNSELIQLAIDLHNEYERLSLMYKWATQKECRVEFNDLPENNKKVMLGMAMFVNERTAPVEKKGLDEGEVFKVIRNNQAPLGIVDAEQLSKAICQTFRPAVDGETSDGYHTFNELYEHRVLLWINYVLCNPRSISYVVENHYDGWFLLGMETHAGQVSYHCPNKYLMLVDCIDRRHPEYDGHSSSDVIDRLFKIAGGKAIADNLIGKKKRQQ